MQAGRLIATELNALNREMHSFADGMQTDDWQRRGNADTNLPAVQTYGPQTVSNASSATISRNNTTFKVSVTDSVSWLVTFTSSDPNVASTSHCENTSLTNTN